MAARSVQERIALIDAKISKKKAEIEALEQKKYQLEHPLTAKAIMAKAKEAGLSLNDIVDKLGLEL